MDGGVEQRRAIRCSVPFVPVLHRRVVWGDLDSGRHHPRGGAGARFLVKGQRFCGGFHANFFHKTKGPVCNGH